MWVRRASASLGLPILSESPEISDSLTSPRLSVQGWFFEYLARQMKVARRVSSSHCVRAFQREGSGGVVLAASALTC